MIVIVLGVVALLLPCGLVQVNDETPSKVSSDSFSGFQLLLSLDIPVTLGTVLFLAGCAPAVMNVAWGLIALIGMGMSSASLTGHLISSAPAPSGKPGYEIHAAISFGALVGWGVALLLLALFFFRRNDPELTRFNRKDGEWASEEVPGWQR